MKEIQNEKAFICDMDGVIYHGSKILDGVREFVNWLIEKDKKFIFLTNSPERTPHELSMKLERIGLKVFFIIQRKIKIRRDIFYV